MMTASRLNLRTLVNSVIAPFGIQLERRSPINNYDVRLKVVMDAFQIGRVIDVGANTGQFAMSLFKAGYMGEVLSVEPLSAAHADLLANSKKYDRWRVLPRMALGADAGHAVINISQNSVSSSLLGMLPAHEQNAPRSGYVSVERVELFTLDSVVDELNLTSVPMFLKIDTQGFEKQVLAGGQACLRNSVLVQMEVSNIPLYEGQSLLSEMFQLMVSSGFKLHSLEPAFFDPATGRVFQYDALFSRQ